MALSNLNASRPLQLFNTSLQEKLPLLVEIYLFVGHFLKVTGHGVSFWDGTEPLGSGNALTRPLPSDGREK
jgi:hypothetical protein